MFPDTNFCSPCFRQKLPWCLESYFTKETQTVQMLKDAFPSHYIRGKKGESCDTLADEPIEMRLLSCRGQLTCPCVVKDAPEAQATSLSIQGNGMTPIPMTKRGQGRRETLNLIFSHIILNNSERACSKFEKKSHLLIGRRRFTPSLSCLVDHIEVRGRPLQKNVRQSREYPRWFPRLYSRWAGSRRRCRGRWCGRSWRS